MIHSPHSAHTELPHDRQFARCSGKDSSPQRWQYCRLRSIVSVVGGLAELYSPGRVSASIAYLMHLTRSESNESGDSPLAHTYVSSDSPLFPAYVRLVSHTLARGLKESVTSIWLDSSEE
jgi:hypothetical protein